MNRLEQLEELRRATASMRHMQRRFFRASNGTTEKALTLRHSREFERRVDEMIAALSADAPICGTCEGRGNVFNQRNLYGIDEVGGPCPECAGTGKR